MIAKKSANPACNKFALKNKKLFKLYFPKYIV